MDARGREGIREEDETPRHFLRVETALRSFLPYLASGASLRVGPPTQRGMRPQGIFFGGNEGNRVKTTVEGEKSFPRKT